MEKSLKYCLSIFVGLILVTIVGCSKSKAIYYSKELSEDRKKVLADQLINGAGTDLYYQGSVAERMIILEAKKYAPDNGDVYRELGVPYLKRGFAKEAYAYYTRASELDPEEWLGYMAYCWLYFYRDYETTLDAIEKYDTLTPGFVDYPQATSVDYMRGICYLQLGNHDLAIKFLQKHMDKEKADVGVEYVEVMPFLALGKAYYENGQYLKADEVFNEGLQHNSRAADLWYHHGQNLLALNKKEEAKKAFMQAEKDLQAGNQNTRAYVEEFFAIYQEDLEAVIF